MLPPPPVKCPTGRPPRDLVVGTLLQGVLGAELESAERKYQDSISTCIYTCVYTHQLTFDLVLVNERSVSEGGLSDECRSFHLTRADDRGRGKVTLAAHR